MKNKFYTIILAANFVASTALYCGNTEATKAKAPSAATVAAPAAKPSKLSELWNSVTSTASNQWTNHRNWFYVGGGAVVVGALVSLHKQGKLPKFLSKYCPNAKKS